MKKWLLLLLGSLRCWALSGSAQHDAQRAAERYAANPEAYDKLSKAESRNPCEAVGLDGGAFAAEGAFLESQWRMLRFQALAAGGKNKQGTYDQQVEQSLHKARSALEDIYARAGQGIRSRNLTSYLLAVNETQSLLLDRVENQRSRASLELLGGIASICERLTSASTATPQMPAANASHTEGD